MTPAERAALVEKLREVMKDSFFSSNPFGDTFKAEAALDLLTPIIRAEALEEAMNIARAKEDEWTTEWRKGMKVDSHLEGKSDGAGEVADAIRALIPSEEKDDK